MTIDKFDLAILAVLQSDARASLQDISKRVGLSSTSCWNRIKKMEADGVIQGYTVRLNAAAIGLTEENDAVAIVVSEERGQIALAMNGRIDRGLSADDLRERLKTFVVQRRGSGRPASAYDA